VLGGAPDPGRVARDRVAGTDTCFVSFHVSVQNIGKTALDVDRVRIRAWRRDLPGPDNDGPGFFDVDDLQDHNQPYLDRTFDSGNLVQHYLPQTSPGETFTWVFPPQQPGIHLFRADAVQQGKSLDFGRQWLDGICPPARKK
jgi:hypothetical protein